MELGAKPGGGGVLSRIEHARATTFPEARYVATRFESRRKHDETREAELLTPAGRGRGDAEGRRTALVDRATSCNCGTPIK